MYFNLLALLSTHLRPQAYLDPGSGSLIVQLLIASLVGAGLMIKLFWKKIKGLFSRSTIKKDGDTPLYK